MKLISETIHSEVGETLMKCRYTDDNGESIERTIPLNSYLYILGHNIRKVVNMVEIPALPKGYFKGYLDPSGAYSVLLCVPSCVRPMYYEPCSQGKVYHYNIPFPKLLCGFHVSEDGILQCAYCFAIKDQDQLSEQTKLYLYPFGNVSSHGKICMGNIKTSGIAFSDSYHFIQMFLDSVTNNDFYSTKSVKGMSQMELLERLKDTFFYPQEWLVPCQTSPTVKHIIRDLQCHNK